MAPELTYYCSSFAFAGFWQGFGAGVSAGFALACIIVALSYYRR